MTIQPAAFIPIRITWCRWFIRSLPLTLKTTAQMNWQKILLWTRSSKRISWHRSPRYPGSGTGWTAIHWLNLVRSLPECVRSFILSILRSICCLTWTPHCWILMAHRKEKALTSIIKPMATIRFCVTTASLEICWKQNFGKELSIAARKQIPSWSR